MIEAKDIFIIVIVIGYGAFLIFVCLVHQFCRESYRDDPSILSEICCTCARCQVQTMDGAAEKSRADLQSCPSDLADKLRPIHVLPIVHHAQDPSTQVSNC